MIAPGERPSDFPLPQRGKFGRHVRGSESTNRLGLAEIIGLTPTFQGTTMGATVFCDGEVWCCSERNLSRAAAVTGCGEGCPVSQVCKVRSFIGNPAATSFQTTDLRREHAQESASNSGPKVVQ